MHLKAGPTARARARKRRQDSAYAQTIRTQVEARDGHCRYAWDVPRTERSRCQGDAEWAHLGNTRRFKTRGLPPEQRHTTGGTLMLCTAHHRLLDAYRLTITAESIDGCDGNLTYQEDK
jgi:hypothetical protein